ncbi:(deoxy)nucleoside triphosphate pyrophosphohydrolase [Nocardioides pantholopis]|uniref:(deoxy)nucleoside triphosphate pyrophosphohydrolase n=1 Tax=Nocardioides pantholopis TaxID=2483798 RepID=UPI001F497B33|nr:NUDIX domain-containing protein [Nocardioides pantholopis]
MEAATRTVVAAAIMQNGRVLATRRTAPPELAGRWELPGGKVEPGERPDDAVEREIAEELGCGIEVTGWLAGAVPIGSAHVLRVATARLTGVEPTPGEHDALRWLGPDELDPAHPDAVDWLEPDRPFLTELAALLRDRPAGTGLRAILFEEDDARAVLARLRADGYDAELVRERLAGEDDDEDHPWAVLSDAPEPVLELLVDEHDGWLDREHQDPAGGSTRHDPLELPTEPRRLHRP